MLQQVAVIASDFVDQTLVVEVEALRDQVRVAPRVLDPAVGIGGEVCIIAEDLIGGDVFLQLDEEARLAHPCVQGVEPLHRVEFVGLDMRLAQRRHAKIDEGGPQFRGTEPAPGGAADGVSCRTHGSSLCGALIFDFVQTNYDSGVRGKICQIHLKRRFL